MAIMELRKKSQVTIPSELVSKLGLKPGDKMEAIEKDGGIFITPVVIYPKGEITRIAKLIKEVENERKNGNTKAYDDVNQAFKDMGIDIDEIV